MPNEGIIPYLYRQKGSMGRIMAIDYGNKRVGIAVTDPLQIIATPLETIHSQDVFPYLKTYFLKEEVEALVVGMPQTLAGKPTDVSSAVVGLVRKLKKEFPDLPIHTVDERYTSRMAKQAMLAGGVKKMDRRDKAMVDRISATIILQSFLESRS
jgi:putative holliday junction resolvase